MRPETAAYLDKARSDLADAREIANIGLATVAARSAYYAAFHAAEAFIMERTGTIAKTHSGVRTKLARLSLTHPEIDRSVLTFLGQGYVYKEISDYGIDSNVTVTLAESQDAITKAADLIDRITAALSA